MGDGQVYSNESSKGQKPCLRAAISRTLAGHMPDDEDIIEAYESSLKAGWHQVRVLYEDDCVIESICLRTNAQAILHPHSIEGMCDLFAFVALEGRALRVLSSCGKLQMVGPFLDFQKEELVNED